MNRDPRSGETRRGDVGQGPRGTRRPPFTLYRERTDVARAEDSRGVAGGRTPHRASQVEAWDAR
jgi:hypothetical protein